jgi:hypothetical protein
MSPTTQKIRIIFKRSAIPRTNDAAPCWPQNTDAVPGHLCGCCNSFSVSVSVLTLFRGVRCRFFKRFYRLDVKNSN